jgi:hypothetical protein
VPTAVLATHRVRLCRESILVVQPTQDRDLHERSAPNRGTAVGRPVRNSLANALVRACTVEVLAVSTKNESKMLLAENDHVIEALGADAPQEPLAHAFAFGARTGVRRTLMPLPSATASKQAPNLSSLSRIRNFGASPHAVASRSCCATQALVGDRVTPKCTTRRDPSSIKKNAKIGRNRRSWDCTKSQAQISLA